MSASPPKLSRELDNGLSTSETSSGTITPAHSVRAETNSRRLRNNAVEHSNPNLPTMTRPISTSTVVTARHAPLQTSRYGTSPYGAYESGNPTELTAPSPTRRLSQSPVRHTPPDAPLLDGPDPNELTVPSPTRSRTSVTLEPYRRSFPPSSQAAPPPIGATESDFHNHYANVQDPPVSSASPSKRRHSPPSFNPSAKPSSKHEPRDRRDNRHDGPDSADEAVPPDFRRRSSSTQHHSSRSRRTAPAFAPPLASSSRRTSQNPPPTPSTVIARLALYSYLIFFSILGTLARLGLQWLTFYPGAPIVTSTLWANFAGSLFMGFLSEDKRLFRESDPSIRASRYSSLEPKSERTRPPSPSKIKKTMPLYIGLATGFCGSLTSFSSFERDVFLALSNHLPSSYYHSTPPGTLDFISTVPRNGGYSFMALIAVIITEIGLSLAALYVGAHLALALQGSLPSLSAKRTRSVMDTLILFLGPGAWLGAVLLAVFPPDRSGSSSETWRGTVLFALVFAPAGCLLRYIVSLKLNRLTQSFPLGTFSVNIFGSAVLAMCYNLQHVRLPSNSIGGGRISCQVLQGIQDGFCGCLTTVSTFVLELTALAKLGPRVVDGAAVRQRSLPRGLRCAWIYGVSSVVSGACIMIIVMGSVLWTIGWSPPICATMRTVL